MGVQPSPQQETQGIKLMRLDQPSGACGRLLPTIDVCAWYLSILSCDNILSMTSSLSLTSTSTVLAHVRATMAATSRRFMEGPLSKWTNVMNGWQYRWFVLDQSAGLLSYYTVGRFTGRALNGIPFLQSDLGIICTVFLWCSLPPVGKWHRNSCSFPLPTFVATNKANSYLVMLMHTCKEWSLQYASQLQPAATWQLDPG